MLARVRGGSWAASRKLKWFDVMMEFHCKATSAWSSYEERKEMPYTQRQWGPKGKLSQLDFYSGPKDEYVRYVHLPERKRCAILGTTIRKTRSQKEEGGRCTVQRKKWTRWRPQDDEQEAKFKKMVLLKGAEAFVESSTIQENIESSAKEVAHTRKDRDSHKRVPPKVAVGEAAAPRCSRRRERRVLRNQAKKAWAENLVKCSLVPRTKGTRRKHLKEPFIDGNFSEKGQDCKEELQRHCMDVYVDLDETNEKQKERIQRCEHLGNEHFSRGRIAEISVDVVLQARARLCDNIVGGLKDKIVSEIVKRLPLTIVFKVANFFEEGFMGRAEVPNSRKIVQLVFLRKPDAESRKGIRSYRALALTAVVHPARGG